VDDLAGCATDDLVGWTERKEGGEQTKTGRHLDGTYVFARRCRGDDHARPRKAELDLPEAAIAKQTPGRNPEAKPPNQPGVRLC